LSKKSPSFPLFQRGKQSVPLFEKEGLGEICELHATAYIQLFHNSAEGAEIFDLKLSRSASSVPLWCVSENFRKPRKFFWHSSANRNPIEGII
jgi:hypothetical protein